MESCNKRKLDKVETSLILDSNVTRRKVNNQPSEDCEETRRKDSLKKVYFRSVLLFDFIL